jgi:hypothetical protein
MCVFELIARTRAISRTRFTKSVSKRMGTSGPFIRFLFKEGGPMGREVAVVLVSAIIAVGLIFALFDERVSFTGPSYRAPTTQTPSN